MRQQLIISGLGGQGILFITRLMAEAAILRGLPVKTSETHGMAQRGGVVISHLKVGDFPSPLVAQGHADGLIVMKEENLRIHGGFLKPGGWTVLNAPEALPSAEGHFLDADRLALSLGAGRSLNLIILGFALARLSGKLFCSLQDVQEVMTRKLQGKPMELEEATRALMAGASHAAASCAQP